MGIIEGYIIYAGVIAVSLLIIPIVTNWAVN